MKQQLTSELDRIENLLQEKGFIKFETYDKFRMYKSNTHKVGIGFTKDMNKYYIYGYFYNYTTEQYNEDYLTIDNHHNIEYPLFPFNIDYIIGHAIALTEVDKIKYNLNG